MTPKIKRQKKVFLNQGKDNDETSNFSRLEATAIAEIPTTVSNFINSLDPDLNEISFRMNLKTGMMMEVKWQAGRRLMIRIQSKLLETRGRK